MADVRTQLPRGRHGLSREEVVRSQRDRILLAMAEAMAENGYVGTSVAQIIRRAGVSRETFYEQFSSKEDCFTGAYARAVELLLGRIGGAGVLTPPADGAPEPSRRQRVDALLRAYLDALASEPAFARLFLIEVYAVGRGAIARRIEQQATFVELVVQVLGARTAEQRFACEALVAAISSMVTARLALDDLDGLRELHGPLLELLDRLSPLFDD
ncbi:TetR/AcrR family transcriptional regulator [Patulibacter defluvii]|uniref:TetR/AcrR family transcriptional regulator n=1 Tax=Patulibacter defluvii TaxID=3095358 RepID=UPI002A759605|nr:TetR/AcrR family transcriptional regulator [Patulibacter sp. DM4]